MRFRLWLSKADRRALTMAERMAIGSYTIIRRLGAGGMGEVYLAEDSRLSRKVALKFLTPEFARDAERMLRFMQEARAASALNHPNIVTVYEVGEGDPAFIATEFVDGMTVRERMTRPLPLPEALDVAVQLVSAIVAAHEAGIIHRDIKPENVMIRPDGYVKLLDFGLAKISSVSGGQETAATQLVTEPGVLVGTLRYMSPEQARGATVDSRTDIFAVGVLIFEMVTGRSAFNGDTPGDRLAAVLTSDPPAPSSLVPGIPPLLDLLVQKALRKNRDERYASANDLLVDLKQIKASIESKPARPRGVRFAPAWVAAAVFAALVAILAVWPRSVSRPPQVSPATATPAPAAIALSYWITVQKYRDGKPFEEPFRLAEAINFEKDYRIRLHFTAPRTGFLYLVSEAPAETSGGSPYNLIAATQLEAAQETQVPEASWFQFDAEKGEERLWIVWSDGRIPELDSSRPFMNPDDKGTIRDAAISGGVAAFLTSHAASRPTVEKDDRTQQTRIRTERVPFVYLLTLEHH
jgi:serine/threonine protein kinase